VFTRRRTAEARASLYADWLHDERAAKESAQRVVGRLIVQLEAKDQEIAALRERLNREQPKPHDPRKGPAMRTEVKP
jgi:hypothetical protein